MEFVKFVGILILFQLILTTQAKRSTDDAESTENVVGTVERIHPNRHKYEHLRRPDRFSGDPDSSSQVLSPSLSNSPYNNLGGGVGGLGGIGSQLGGGLQSSYLGGAGGLGGLGGYQNPYLTQSYLGGAGALGGLGSTGLYSGSGLGGLGGFGQQNYLGGYQNPYLGLGGGGGILGNSYNLGGLGGLQGSYLGGGGLGLGNDLYSGGGLGLGGGIGSLYGNPYLNNGALGLGGAGLLGNGVYNPLLYRNTALSAGNPYLTSQNALNPYSAYSQLNPYNSYPLTSRFGLGLGGNVRNGLRTNSGSSINSNNNNDE